MQRIFTRLLACAIGSPLFGNAAAATFTVTSELDDGSSGTLRWAIEQANNNAGADTIAFSIGFGQKTINLQSELPLLSDHQTTINGTTQPGYTGTPVIRIDGSALGAGARGLYVRGDQTTVNSLAFTRFGGDGIFVENLSADGIITGCYLGVALNGQTAAGNGFGLTVDGSGYTIGGVNAAHRNLISGNSASGVQIVGNGSNNRLWRNYIGTTASGLAALPNGAAGVLVGGHGNFIGDVSSSQRNIISANGDAGIVLYGANNQVRGNYIGLASDGVGDLGNAAYGVVVHGDGNSIGSTGGGGNVISGNGGHGIYVPYVDGVTIAGNRIGLNANGTAAVANAGDGIYVGSSTAFLVGGPDLTHANYIAGNAFNGVVVTGSESNAGTIAHNVIGLGSDGVTAIGNSSNGIAIGTLGNGSIAIDGNVIAASAAYGLSLGGGNVVVSANRIGTNVAGTLARPNNGGIGLFASTASIDGNLISGNHYDGIAVNSSQASAEIIGNRIGTSADGLSALANSGNGIRVVTAAPGLVIGAPGMGNQISGNVRGIALDAGSSGVILQGNNIGLDASENTKLGNSETGVYFNGNDHQFGGISAGARNLVSGNGTAMRIGAGSGHHIEGNFFGTNAALDGGLGNAVGVINNGGHDFMFGGSIAGAGNVVSGNTYTGVRLEQGQGAALLGNRVYGNGEFNIDIAPDNGVNVNDALDPDQGPNAGQNHPELTAALPSGMNIAVSGRLRSKPNSEYRIEYFRSSSCHGSGFGQGESYLGSESVLTDGSGEATLDFVGSDGINSGVVTATATDSHGNTSEYGNCISIGAAVAGEFNVMALWHYSYEDLGVAEIIITRSKGASGAVSVQFDTANHQPPTALSGLDFAATSQTLNFAHGETSKSVLVPILGDALVEGMEDFDVKLSAATGGATLGALATGRVVIYDHEPSLNNASINDAITSEPSNGSTQAVFTVTLGADVATRTIHYTTVDGSATAGSDYTPTSGDLVFLPGETSKTVQVAVKADALLEADEYFELMLSESDPNLHLLRASGVGAIVNTGGVAILFADGFD